MIHNMPTKKKEVIVTKKDNKDTKKLTPKEELFVDYYFETLFNATESYCRAYGNDNRETCKTNGSRLLSKAHVRKAIDERKELLHNDNIATAQEILIFFSDVVRGKVKDQLGFETSVKDRLKAAEKLALRDRLFKEDDIDDNEPREPKIEFTIINNSKLEEELYRKERNEENAKS